FIDVLFYAGKGDQILTSGSIKVTIDYWNALSGKLIRSVEAEKGGARVLSVSRDGKYIISAGPDGGLKLWRASNGNLGRSFGNYGKPIQSAAFSPDGRMLVSADGETEVKVWSVRTGRLLLKFPMKSQRADAVVAFAPDGRRIATAGGSFALWTREGQ